MQGAARCDGYGLFVWAGGGVRRSASVLANCRVPFPDLGRAEFWAVVQSECILVYSFKFMYSIKVLLLNFKLSNAIMKFEPALFQNQCSAARGAQAFRQSVCLDK